MKSPAELPPNAFRQLAEAHSTLLTDFLARLPAAGPDFLALVRQLALGPEAQRGKLRALEEDLYRRHGELWARIVSGAGEPEAAGEEDPRFAAPAWRELPFFRYLRAAYGLNVRFLEALGELAELDPHARRRLRFVLRQLGDAMAPTNFAATNPEVLRLAAESGGESLARGLKLLTADLARGRISMTDEQAFEVGRSVAATAGTVVLENEVMQLIQYAPSTDQVRERPLLVVPPFINKYYILDLQPENSFVRYCVAQGFSTFIVSWRNVPPQLGALGWDDYVQKGVIEPLEAVLAISGSSKANTLGFCVGGTLLATALAVLARRDRPLAGSLTLLASLLDFSDTGEISVFVDRAFVEAAEAEYAEGGVMPGSRLAATFATLRANDLVWRFVVENYLKGQAPPAFDLLYWNSDGANVPGRLYAWYLRNMYLENSLRIPGKLVACGVPVDLGRIDLPAYVLATLDDHIVPWKTAFAGVELLGPQAQFVLGASGHVAGVVNPAARGRKHYWTGTPGAAGDPDAWLARAGRQPGSWWSHWSRWLGERSGALKPAPSAPGNGTYPGIEAAPGRYVRERPA